MNIGNITPLEAAPGGSYGITLRRIYRTLRELIGADAIPAETRALFDRLLATAGLGPVRRSVPKGAALAAAGIQSSLDLTAGTFVISERSASSLIVPTLFFPPPGLEYYCAQLDVSRVDSEQFLLVRNFLLRVANLEVGARYALAARLATLAGAEATLVARTREDLQTWVALHPGDGSAWRTL